MTPPSKTTLQSLLADIRWNTEEVGGCQEWQGKLTQRVPVVYVPADVLYPGSSKALQSVRAILYLSKHGHRLPAGHVMRVSCRNDRCISDRHMVVMPRSEHVKEQGRRGELSTQRRCIARKLSNLARGVTKLNDQAVSEIQMSDEPSKVLAERYGVTSGRINQLRRQGRTLTIPGASVFSWRP